MLNFLTDNLKQALTHINLNTLYEMRLRAGREVKVNVGGEYLYLTGNGTSKFARNACRIERDEIDEILSNACQKSVYSVSEELKQGFVTTERGVRIGIGGTFVTEGERVLSVRDFSSLCIRIPHTVDGCAEKVIEVCLKELSSVLILSPPGMGKTTLLKDIINRLSDRYNLLIADERGELCEKGTMADAIRFAAKRTAFSCGLRAMRPDMIVTDELTDEDYPAVKKTVHSGVCVIASAHLASIDLAPKNIFDFIVLLSSKRVGKVERIADKAGNMIYG